VEVCPFRLFALAALSAAAFAQAPDSYEKARAAMEASVARQLASVEQQRTAIRRSVPASAPAEPFYTAPWAAAPPIPAAAVSAEDCDPVPEEQIGPMIEEISKREGLTPDLLRAVIRKESAFLPCAVSPKGAIGLMQLMPATAADLGVQNPFDPKENLEAGAKFLGRLLSRYGDTALALGAYNAGPARVDAAGGVPRFPETQDYVFDILNRIQNPKPPAPVR
jgi:soluble lytic murein transglycosylase-like protein